MKLWMSAELDADVDAKFMAARKPIMDKVNAQLQAHTFTSPWKSWDFICMIMSDEDAYKEVAKKSKKDMSLEFRLKADHGQFLQANPQQAARLVIDALGRSVDKMAGMDVTEPDIQALRAALAAVAKEV